MTDGREGQLDMVPGQHVGRPVVAGLQPVRPEANARGSGGRSKYWCFTLNNPTVEEVQSISGLVEGRDASYLIFGRERGARERTSHLQGYIEFEKRVRLAHVKQLLGGRVHLEQRRGTGKQASDYCKKDGDFDEFGSLSQVTQGKRSDLEAIREEIKAGADELSIAEAHFSTWVVYRRSFSAYRDLLRPPDGLRLELRVILLWGAAGTGKSRYAYAKSPGLFRVPSHDLKWFTGYDGHEAILIDDYRGDAPESKILQLLDIYPIQVAVHYGFQPLRATTIYITTNMQPSQLHNYPNEASRAAWKRRFHECRKFVAPMWDPEDPNNSEKLIARVEELPYEWE